MSKKKAPAIIAVAATASPGHKCQSLIAFNHRLTAIYRAPCRDLRALENEEYESCQQCHTEHNHQHSRVNQV